MALPPDWDDNEPTRKLSVTRSVPLPCVSDSVPLAVPPLSARPINTDLSALTEVSIACAVTAPVADPLLVAPPLAMPIKRLGLDAALPSKMLPLAMLIVPLAMPSEATFCPTVTPNGKNPDGSRLPLLMVRLPVATAPTPAVVVWPTTGMSVTTSPLLTTTEPVADGVAPESVPMKSLLAAMPAAALAVPPLFTEAMSPEVGT